MAGFTLPNYSMPFLDGQTVGGGNTGFGGPLSPGAPQGPGGTNTGFGGPLDPGPGGNPYSTSYDPTNNYYTGNMGNDVNNYLNHYPSDHTVFSSFDAQGNPTAVNPLYQVGQPKTVGTGQDFSKAEDYAGDLSHVVYNPDGSYNLADSPLAQGQLAQLATGYENNVDQEQKNTAGQLANGLSTLAMTGGYDSGARERMAQSSGQSGDAALQSGLNQYRQGQQAIRTNDANYKAGIQEQLPGLYQGLDQYQTGNEFRDVGNKMNADSFNAQVANGGLNNMNSFDMGKYMFGGNVLGSTYATQALGGGGVNPYANTPNGPTSSATGPVPQGFEQAIPQGTQVNQFGNMANGDFSEGSNHYEDFLPGVAQGKLAYNTLTKGWSV